MTKGAAQLNALQSHQNVQSDFHQFEKAVALWEKYNEPGVLGDILSFALLPSYDDLRARIIDIGAKALRSGSPVTVAQRFMIGNLTSFNQHSNNLEFPEPGEHQKEQLQPFARPIQDLRQLLRSDPKNALALLDFAQLQAAIGRNDVAERSLRTALGLAPNNRLVLRTLARFYVHVGQAEQAHFLLRRHAGTPSDPWLISSEIALADLVGTPSIFLTKGRRMVTDAGKASTPSYTELAGSVAMIELGSGNLKRARELQRIALLYPTDNVVAQAVDREQQFGIALNAPNVERAIAASAEAQMLQAWLNEDPNGVEANALEWHNEEPFSSRPIQILTYMFAYRGDTKRALNWLNVGLRTDGTDSGLLLNLAYVQACAGQLDQARTTIAKTRRLWGQQSEPYLVATEGIIAYQVGRFEEGDRLYARAFALFDLPEIRRHNISTLCVLNQAISALQTRHPRASEIVARTNEAIQKRPNPDAAMLLKIATAPSSGVVQAASLPLQPQLPQSRLRLTSQWFFDSKANTLTERKGLTAPGAKSIILLKDGDEI